MAGVRFAAGPKLNILERSSVTLTAGTADPLFPLTNLYDGRPNRPFRFSTLEDEQEIVVDANVVVGGDFETISGFPVGWTENNNGGTGDVTRTTVAGNFNGGASGAQLAGGDAGISMYQDFEVRSGEARRIVVWLKGDGTNAVTVTLQNLTTGRYLHSSGSWSPTSAGSTLFSHTSSTGAFSSKDYTVESYFKCDGSLVTLRVTISMAATFTGFADDCYDYPNATMLSLHGVELEDRCLITWEEGDGVSFSPVATIGSAATGFSADQKPTCYVALATPKTAARAHRITLGSVAPGSAPLSVRGIGELVISQPTTAARNYDWGAETKYAVDRIRNESSGGPNTYQISRWPPRVFAAPWQFVSASQMREVRDELYTRAAGDVHNVLLVPDDSMNTVFLGRLTDAWAVKRRFNEHYVEGDLLLAELPFVSNAL